MESHILLVYPERHVQRSIFDYHNKYRTQDHIALRSSDLPHPIAKKSVRIYFPNNEFPALVKYNAYDCHGSEIQKLSHHISENDLIYQWAIRHHIDKDWQTYE